MGSSISVAVMWALVITPGDKTYIHRYTAYLKKEKTLSFKQKIHN